MTDQIPAYVHEAATTRSEVWGNGHSPDGSGAYSTLLTLAIKTADLTRIDLTRPIMIHQEADTPTGPNTLAVGSEWEDVDALTRACEETGRDQIAVIDKDGDVSVWGADAGWWETGAPDFGFAPFTIIHDGKKAHQ